MKREPIITLLAVLLLCFTLSSCAGRQKDSAPTAEEYVGEQPYESVYVTLPPARSHQDDLVFFQLEEEDGAAAKAVYQDVSQVTNAIALTSAYGGLGERVTLPLKVCGQVNFCALDMTVAYDPTQLKFCGAENANDDALINCDEVAGMLYLNFVRIVNLEDSVTLCDLCFEVVGGQETTSLLHLQVADIIALDQNDQIVNCNFSVVDGYAYLNRPTP